MIIIFEGGDSVLVEGVKAERGYKDTIVEEMFISDIFNAISVNDNAVIEEKTRDLKNFNEIFKPIYILEKGNDASFTAVFRAVLSGYENKIEVDLADKTVPALIKEVQTAIKNLNK